ncbi:MAG: signal recognition particle-docking protein FtsY, partial [Deltaproteobacteria bacterium]|nr:signal recognition particle-docking protein FtsY [Deltaproteobacteria bacterium]
KELNIPIRFIGVGEGVRDLREFYARDFADALI